VKASHSDGETGIFGFIDRLNTIERDVDEHGRVEGFGDSLYSLWQLALLPLAPGKSTTKRRETIQEETLTATRQRLCSDERVGSSRVVVLNIHEALHDKLEQSVGSFASVRWH